MSESDLSKYSLELCEKFSTEYHKYPEKPEYEPDKEYLLNKDLEKYWRVIETKCSRNHGDFVLIFIDNETGDVYGQESCGEKPNQITRFNLLDEASRRVMYHFFDIDGWFVCDGWETADEEIKKQTAIEKALMAAGL